MQAPGGKIVDQTVDGLIARAKDIRKSVEDFILKLKHEHHTMTWPSVLDSFALLSGQISSLLSAMKSDKTPPLKNYPIIPLKLSQDRDQRLQDLTDGRVEIMSHAQVPDYLRTKPDPEVEKAEKQLLMDVGSVSDQSSSVNMQNQLNQYDKNCQKILDKIRTARQNWKADSVTARNLPATFDPKATQELIAAVYHGRGVKPPMQAPQQVETQIRTTGMM